MSEQRTAIVTGASRGIGRGIAVALGADGWDVVVNYAGNAAAADETVALVEQAGGRAATVQGDVSVGDDREAIVAAALDTFGSIDALVNNAGITSPDRGKDMLEQGEASWDRVMDVNLKGPHFLTQRVAAWMTANPRNGMLRTVVNVSSISRIAVSTDRADYCVSKAAMGMVTRAWAARLAGEGINVYEVCPGVTASDMTAGVAAKYDRMIHEEGLLPIPRWGKPADVGRAVAMLAGGAMSYSTGETVNVDGGFHIRRL